MVGVKLSQAADPEGIIGCLNNFTEVDVIRVEFEIDIASVTSEFSLSPSGTRKDTAPSGAVVWDGGLVGGSGGGGSAGELGRAVLWW